MSGGGRLITCGRCQRDRRNHGRGLCSACYSWATRRGLLDTYARDTRDRLHTYAEWLELQAQGYTRQHAADRLGITLHALEQAITRTQRAAQW